MAGTLTPDLSGSLVDMLPLPDFLKKGLGFFFDSKAMEAGGAVAVIDKLIGDDNTHTAIGAAVAFGLEKMGMSRVAATVVGVAVSNIENHPILASLALLTVAATQMKDHPLLAMGAMMAVLAFDAYKMMSGPNKPAPAAAPAAP